MHLSPLFWFYFWWGTPHLILLVIVLLMLGKSQVRHFPLFFAYSIFEVLQFCPLLFIVDALSLRSPAYHFAFVVGEIGSTSLRFAIIYEVFRCVVQPSKRLDRLGRDLFGSLTILLLLSGVILAGIHSGEKSPFLATYTVLARTVSLLQCGLLVGILAFSRYFVIQWRNPAFGIALGFGLYEASELAIAALRQTGNAFVWLNSLETTSYLCAVVIWLIFFLLPENPRETTLKGIPSQQLEEWNRELQRFSRRSS